LTEFDLSNFISSLSQISNQI